MKKSWLSFDAWVFLLFMAMFGEVLNVPVVKASRTIYIRADGSIDPSTAPITTVDNVTYTFTDNMNEGIVVQRSNIIIDGNRHTLDGSALGLIVGFNLTGVSNVTVTDTNITGFGNGPGIQLFQVSNSIVSRNNITCFYGVSLSSSSNNSVYGNNIRVYYMLRPYSVGISLSSSNSNNIYANEISWSDYGIRFESSGSNAIFGNTVAANNYGISLSSSSNNSIYGNHIGANYNYNVGFWSSSGNRFYHNNVIGAPISPNSSVELNNSTDTWHDGYPSGGNYWGGGLILPTDVDVKSGPYQNETGSDGIVDALRVIDANNTDNYPLMGMFNDFSVDWADRVYRVTTICNSTISNFEFGVVSVYPDHIPGPPWTTSIIFNITSSATGFCRIGIPKDVLNGDYVVTFNGFSMPPSLWRELPISNATTLYLYLNYPAGTHKIWIMGTTTIPEFPSLIILPTFIVLTTLAVFLTKRILRKPKP